MDEVVGPNAQANRPSIERGRGGGSVEALELVWGEPLPPRLRDLDVDLVLGADVVFDEELFEILAQTLQSLLPTARSATAVTADAGKCSAARAEQGRKGKCAPEASGNPGGALGGGRRRRNRGGGNAQSRGRSRPEALFSYRVRERCARHGCDTAAFFALLREKSYTVEELELAGQAAEMSARGGQVTAKKRQEIKVVRVRGADVDS